MKQGQCFQRKTHEIIEKSLENILYTLFMSREPYFKEDKWNSSFPHNQYFIKLEILIKKYACNR